MKKQFLLGTTALIAAGLMAGGVAQVAQAAEEPISMGIGGYYRTAILFASQDNATGEIADNNDSMALATDIELTVSGSTTLDNGITAGFTMQLTGNANAQGSDTLDERHLFFRGGFGEVRLGSTESARQAMASNTPTGNWNIGVNSPFFQAGTGGGLVTVRTGDDGLGNEDSIKLMYFSPTFNGFRFGTSYSPNGSLGSEAYGATGGDAAGATKNETAVAAQFSHSFGDVGLSLSAGHEEYVTESVAANLDTRGNDNPSSSQIGGSVSMGEWTVGGEILQADQILNSTAGSGMEREDMAFGILYSAGQISASLGYGHAEIDVADGTVDEMDVWKLQGTYVIGPGINIGAGLELGEFDDATNAAGLDNQWSGLAVTANLAF